MHGGRRKYEEEAMFDPFKLMFLRRMDEYRGGVMDG